MSQWAREHPEQDYDEYFEQVRVEADNRRKRERECIHKFLAGTGCCLYCGKAGDDRC